MLQHGRTPRSDVTPRIEIRNATTTKSFAARPTKQPGVYRASVTFRGPRWWLAVPGLALILLAAIVVVPKRRRRSRVHQPQAA